MTRKKVLNLQKSNWGGGSLNKGFTLIELLAVIVILAIIAAIATPIILGIVDDVKKQAFERSVEMSIKSFDLFRTSNENVKRIEITDERLPLNDSNFISGSLLSLNDGAIEAYNITDGKYCATGKIGQLEVTNGACNGDMLDDFVINTYILNINPNGGIWNETSDLKEVPIENNSELDLINPTRDGFKFTGWKMLVVGNIDDPDNGTLTTQLIANWEANTYDLAIDPNGGIYEESINTKIVKLESENWYELKDITREGYVFDGWEISSESTKIVGNQLQMGNENTTIKAKWKKIYTLTINLDGGESTQNLSFEMVNGESISLVRPIKTNNIFDKWEIAGIDSKIESDIFTMGNEDTTITAKWIKLVFGLTIDTNGGETTQSKTHELTVGDTVILTEPTKAGYAFKNWSVSGTDSKVENNVFTMGTEASVVTANWEVTNYSITYNLNGGTQGSEAITSYTIETETISLPTPTRTGYTFDGWYEESDFSGTKVTQITKGTTGNKIYYAKWTKTTYSITYNLNSGTQASGAKTSYTIETATFSLPTPTRTGYTFDGWYEKSDFSGTKVTQITKGTTGNKTYYAKWTANKYTVNYDCNGGSGSTTSSTHTYGTSKKLTSSGCTGKIVTGTGTGTSATPMIYQFAGWSKSNSATTATYTDAQSVSNLTTNESITLYAVWEKMFTYSNKYTVLDDGSGNWRVKFLTSGKLKMNFNLTVDAFLVGGGGGGGAFGGGTGGGGGGGYTTTGYSKSLTTTSSYTITIGKGGTGATYPSEWGPSEGGTGGTTSAFNLKATGGSGSGGQSGGSGGSGGAPAGAYEENGGNGGSYGSAGTGGWSYGTGQGQGETTCEFGEGTTSGCSAGVTAYSGGGGGGPLGKGGTGGGTGGCWSAGEAGTENTGGGGGGGHASGGGAGGSGIVIIRNAR